MSKLIEVKDSEVKKEVKESKISCHFSPAQLIEGLSEIIDIDNLYRSSKSQKNAELFKIVLQETVEKIYAAGEQTLYSLLEVFFLLGDTGVFSEKTKKKKWYLDAKEEKLIPIPIKFLLDSARMVRVPHFSGVYFQNNSIHCASVDDSNPNAGKNLFSAFFHEMIHLVFQVLLGNPKPQPEEEWEQLTDLIIKEMEEAKHKGILNEKYHFFLVCCYPKEKKSEEMPPRILQYLLDNDAFEYPKLADNIFKEETIRKMVHLIQVFSIKVNELKNNLMQLRFFYPGRTSIFSYLKKENMDLFLENVNPKNYAAFNLNPIIFSIKHKKISLLNQFLERGFGINSPGKFLQTPLHFATGKGEVEFVKLLLEKKADPNLIDNDGRLPLHLACEVKNIDIFKILLPLTQNPNLKNYYNMTPLFFAVNFENMIATELLIKINDDVNVQEIFFGLTLLMLAANRNNIFIVKKLLEKNADPRLCCRSGETALDFAARQGGIEVCKILLERLIDLEQDSAMRTEAQYKLDALVGAEQEFRQSQSSAGLFSPAVSGQAAQGEALPVVEQQIIPLPSNSPR